MSGRLYVLYRLALFIGLLFKCSCQRRSLAASESATAEVVQAHHYRGTWSATQALSLFCLPTANALQASSAQAGGEEVLRSRSAQSCGKEVAASERRSQLLFNGELSGGVHRFCYAAYSAFSELYDDFTSFPIA